MSRIDIHDYAEQLKRKVHAGDWLGIEQEIHGINLPDGWQEMVRPMFEGLAGKDLSVEVVPFADLPEHTLHWLRMAPPEVLDRTPSAVRLAYDDSGEDGESSGNLELAIYEGDSGSAILMVGG